MNQDQPRSDRDPGGALQLAHRIIAAAHFAYVATLIKGDPANEFRCSAETLELLKLMTAEVVDSASLSPGARGARLFGVPLLVDDRLSDNVVVPYVARTA